MKFYNSLRFRLFIWYLLSLLFLGFFIILTIHIYQYRYSNYILFLFFLCLSTLGFFIIYRFTNSLTYLSHQIERISSKNLDERIKTINSNDEIGELATSFNRLLNRLDTAFKRERQFIADVAHEMKTPLSTLRSSFEVTLQNERTNDEYRRIVRDSIIETDRLTNTLKDVLDLAWSEVPNENVKEQFNLSELMYELVEIAQKLATKKQITTHASVQKEVKFTGFRDRLGRAILNIIDNAIKYTPHNGRVEIKCSVEHSHILVSVKDTGVGIEDAEFEHIFDRFYRGNKTSTIFGAGLGLAIAKATIILHKGTIQVKSTRRKGSEFIIILPNS